MKRTICLAAGCVIAIPCVAVTVAAVGCSRDDPASPIMVESQHSHYHVHAVDASHDHTHGDGEAVGGHKHSHEHAE